MYDLLFNCENRETRSTVRYGVFKWFYKQNTCAETFGWLKKKLNLIHKSKPSRRSLNPISLNLRWNWLAPVVGEVLFVWTDQRHRCFALLVIRKISATKNLSSKLGESPPKSANNPLLQQRVTHLFVYLLTEKILKNRSLVGETHKYWHVVGTRVFHKSPIEF